MKLLFKIIIAIAILIYITYIGKSKYNYEDEELKLIIENYVGDAVDNFSEEIDTLGGFASWKNYRDYVGLSEEGFKERLNETWKKKYDVEILEHLINTKLQRKGVSKQIKLNNGDEYIDEYTISLLSPIFEEAIGWAIL